MDMDGADPTKDWIVNSTRVRDIKLQKIIKHDNNFFALYKMTLRNSVKIYADSDTTGEKDNNDLHRIRYFGIRLNGDPGNSEDYTPKPRSGDITKLTAPNGDESKQEAVIRYPASTAPQQPAANFKYYHLIGHN
ncbi:MAG: hypothetical protein R3C19_24615 [Planctomycetaceae bacterium]